MCCDWRVGLLSFFPSDWAASMLVGLRRVSAASEGGRVVRRGGQLAVVGGWRGHSGDDEGGSGILCSLSIVQSEAPAPALLCLVCPLPLTIFFFVYSASRACHPAVSIPRYWWGGCGLSGWLLACLACLA